MAAGRTRGAVTAFLRCHPCLANHTALPPQVLPERLLRHTALIDLTRPEDALRAGLHGTHRRQIRRARRAGCQVTWTEGAGSLDEFASLYAATMNRVHADDYYALTADYFAELPSLLEGRCGMLAARRDGRPLAALLLMWGPTLLHYHLGGSLDEARGSGLNHLLFWEAIRMGRERGLTGFHLGGGISEGDGLIRFKSGFGARLLPWWKACLVFDREAEQALSAGCDPDGLFFPAYRAPKKA